MYFEDTLFNYTFFFYGPHLHNRHSTSCLRLNFWPKIYLHTKIISSIHIWYTLFHFLKYFICRHVIGQTNMMLSVFTSNSNNGKKHCKKRFNDFSVELVNPRSNKLLTSTRKHSVSTNKGVTADSKAQMRPVLVIITAVQCFYLTIKPTICFKLTIATQKQINLTVGGINDHILFVRT